MQEKRNSIMKNVFHLFYSTALSSMMNAAALIVLASFINKGVYGKFSVVLAFAMIMAYMAEAGLNQIVLREGAKKEASVTAIMASFIKLRLLLTAFSLLIGFLLIHWWYQGDKEFIILSYALILPLVIGISMQSISITYFQMKEKMQYSGYIRIVSSILLIAFIMVGKWFAINAIVVFFLYGSAYMAAGCFGIYLTMRDQVFSFKTPFYKEIRKNWLPFMVTGFLFILLPQIGPIILEHTLSWSEIGYFAVAYRIPQALQQVPFIIAGAFYPVLFRLFEAGDHQGHVNKSITQVKLMGLVGMLAALPFFHLSDIVINLLFGEKWMGASMLLKILSLVMVFQGLSIAIGDGLTTRALQKRRMTVQGMAVVSGLILYTVCSKEYGLAGAAVAGVLVEGILLIGLLCRHPDRASLFKRAVFPYLTFFFVGLWLIESFFSSVPLLAFVIHLAWVLSLIWLDKEWRRKGWGVWKEVPLFRKWKTKFRKEAHDGAS
ncbi:oligosaccharide flippase family protein [Rossellomorea vietnamensis]|uniref:lipopolysaccharide biosynthesis protein n=1 Tax=Rossellomorea vietnamensis TaxID=218284 RepID=UPI001CCE37C6|nr:oligosaccharide flippase family protein [Rossellomorea vietnamensis]MCA0149772.1 oligosaccharide flippase family protein [Rossellomorea vietnamensis]